MTHTLIIDSLHDIDARCSCGHWHFISPTCDTDDYDTIIARIRHEYRKHTTFWRHKNAENNNHDSSTV